jgi:hypothetical protein
MKVFILFVALALLSSIASAVTQTMVQENSTIQYYGYGNYGACGEGSTDNSAFILSALNEFDDNDSSYAQAQSSAQGACIFEIFSIPSNAINTNLHVVGKGLTASGRNCSLSVSLYDFGTSLYESVLDDYSNTVQEFVIPIQSDDRQVGMGTDTVKMKLFGTYYNTYCAPLWHESRIVYDINTPDGCMNGICCNYDQRPMLSRNIDWKCTTDQSAQCLVGIFWNSTLLTVSPSVADVNNYGRISIMDAKNGILNFRLDTVDLYPEMTYRVHVFCHSNASASEYVGEITPQYKNLNWLASRFGFVKENLGYFMGAGILFIFLAIVILMIKVILP